MRLPLATKIGALLAAASFFFNSCTTGYAPMSPMYSPPGSDSAAARAPSEERPGLATGWGEEKDSVVSYRQFTRASCKPIDTDVVFYNNPTGLEAMAPNRTKVSGSEKMAGGLIEWGIKSGYGFLPTYREGRYGRRLVSGKQGSEYRIWIKNHGRSSLEVVASVDGLDVQDGKTASFSKRGYIVGPGKTLEISGFRTGYGSVAAFEFSGVADSYASLRHGDTRNVGVIGLAVFTRAGISPWSSDSWTRKSASPFAEAP